VNRNTGTAGSQFEVQYRLESVAAGDTNEISVAARAVVVACDAGQAGRMLRAISPQFQEPLNAIPYAPVAVVALGYRREAIGRPLNGFGFLIPRKEGLRTLGTVWNTSLFPGRAPEGHVLLTSFAGGATDTEICGWSEDRIAATVHEELARALNIHESPVARHVQINPQAIPQYNLGHGQITESVNRLCDETPGLYLAGNYLEGPSTGACVARSFRIASEIENFLKSGTTPGSSSSP
jgi:oxygen-dependent protoporphyrinogen oxidase